MGVYKLSRTAESDLINIYEFGIETFGLNHAQEYLLGLHRIFEILSDDVSLGPDASEFVSALKRFSYKSHTIFYLSNDAALFIVRVLHQSMDYDVHL